MYMAYCPTCGERLPKNAFFCPNCGKKTVEAVEKNIPGPSDEVKEAFTKMSQELEKAFSEAAKEISTAFQTASENIQKSLCREQIVCSNCGVENPNNAVFCYNCGKKARVK